MKHSLIVDLADCTEFRQTVQACPPRIVHGTALLLTALLGSALVWAAITRADLVVRARGRVRPVDAVHRIFNPVRAEVLSASSGGRVVEVHFREGDAVHKGQTLLRFDTARLDNEIARQEQKIQAGEAELRELARLQEMLAQLRQTAEAKARADLNQAQEEIERAKQRRALEIRLAETELVVAQDEETRTRQLVPQSAASAAELVKATARRREADQKLTRAGIAVEESRLQVLEQALALVEKTYAVKRQELVLQRAAKRTEVEAAGIELANMGLERQQAVLRAPLDGIVTAGQIKVGDLLEPGKPVLEIASQKGFRFEALVSSEDVGHLRVGMFARIKLDAYDYQKYGTVAGTVCFISPDSGIPQEQQAAGASSGTASSQGHQAAVYLVKIDLQSDTVGLGSFTGQVKLGMAGQMDMVTGQEGLLWLLLKKVRQTISVG